MVIALRDKNILGHRLVDGWTRWVACAYSGLAKTNPKQQSIEGKRSMDFLTLMTLKLTANEIGTDQFGNRYYEERRARAGKHVRVGHAQIGHPPPLAGGRPLERERVRHVGRPRMGRGVQRALRRDQAVEGVENKADRDRHRL